MSEGLAPVPFGQVNSTSKKIACQHFFLGPINKGFSGFIFLKANKYNAFKFEKFFLSIKMRVSRLNFFHFFSKNHFF